MKRMILLVLYLIFGSLNVPAQITFNRSIDDKNWYQLLYSLRINTKGYFCSGISATPYIGKVFLVEFDTLGNELWRNEFDIPGYYRTEVMDASPIDSTSYMLIANARDSTGNVDNLLIKINETGDTIWTKINKDTNFQSYVKIIKLTDDSTFIIGGNINNSNNNNYQNIVLQKVDFTGNIIWQKEYNFSPYFSSCKDLIAISDKGFLICGYRWNVAAEKRDVLLIRTDSLGNLLWQRTYGGNYKDWAGAVIASKEGGFLIEGSKQTKKGFTTFTDEYKGWLIKVDSIGNVEWDSIYGPDNIYFRGDFGYALHQLSDSSYICVGGVDGAYHGAGGDLAWVVKTDRFGNIIWQHTYTRDSTKHHYFYDLQPTADRGFIACGSTWNDSTWQDGWIVKLDSMGCPYGSGCGATGLVVLPAPQKENLFIYPNPSSGIIQISLSPVQGEATCRLYNAVGQTVLEQQIPAGTGRLSLDISTLPRGWYVLRLQTKERVFSGKVMLE